VPPLPHHRAYGSVPRRFDWVKRGAPLIRQATACNCLGNCHRPPPARALIEGVGFAADSPLEGSGFELSVPLGRATASNRLLSRCYPRTCHPRERDFGCPLEPEAEGQRGPRACFTIG
jgi:hypothetical protein